MNRRGHTLVEMIVVISIGAIMMSLSLGVLHSLYRAERTGRERVHQTIVSTRLAEQFRGDAAAALARVEKRSPEQAQWEFAFPDGRSVTYRALPGEVQRDERADGKLLRHESYVLPDHSTADIAVQNDAGRATATLSIATSGPMPREIRVVAPLGKDNRFRNVSAKDR